MPLARGLLATARFHLVRFSGRLALLRLPTIGWGAARTKVLGAVSRSGPGPLRIDWQPLFIPVIDMRGREPTGHLSALWLVGNAAPSTLFCTEYSVPAIAAACTAHGRPRPLVCSQAGGGSGTQPGRTPIPKYAYESLPAVFYQRR